MKKASIAIAASFLVTSAAVSEGCRNATQVELVVTYGGLCSDLGGVGFIIATDADIAEGRIENNVFTTTSGSCTQGVGGQPSRVGTLVITPNDSTDRASVIVLASFGKRVEECKARDGYFGCIIARRRFAFVQHTGLTLDISLDPSCKNVPCNAVSTCNKGACVDSSLDCGEGGCLPHERLSDGGQPPVDAPMDPDAFLQGDQNVPADASRFDAGFDAGKDAGFDAGSDASFCEPPNLDLLCEATPTGPKTCSMSGGQSCCYSSGGDGGASGYDCRAGGACQPTMQNPNLFCRSAAQCPDNSVCCFSQFMGSGGAFCSPMACPSDGGLPSQLCETPCECRTAGTTCRPNQFTLGMPITQHLSACAP